MRGGRSAYAGCAHARLRDSPRGRRSSRRCSAALAHSGRCAPDRWSTDRASAAQVAAARSRRNRRPRLPAGSSGAHGGRWPGDVPSPGVVSQAVMDSAVSSPALLLSRPRRWSVRRQQDRRDPTLPCPLRSAGHRTCRRLSCGVPGRLVGVVVVDPSGGSCGQQVNAQHVCARELGRSEAYRRYSAD